MFTERFETSLKLLTHIRFLKIGSATTQAVPVIFQGPEKVACTLVPRGHVKGISGQQWERMGTLQSFVKKQNWQCPTQVVNICLDNDQILKSVNIKNYFRVLLSLCKEESE